VHPSFPAKTVPEFIAYAKNNPGKVSYGSAGIGTVSHVCGEYFASATGTKLVHIPYKGTGPALSDLIGGHIPAAFAPIPATYENSKAGTMRMLAVTSAQRSTLAPEVPTIAEQGVPGFEAVLRYALVGPAGVPRPIIDKLNKALNAALATDEVRKRLALEGAEPVPGTPEEYAADLDREVTLWAKVVKESGAKAD
jgi:tripartite-type tricarboxylate transporter receptor subunit TctC